MTLGFVFKFPERAEQMGELVLRFSSNMLPIYRGSSVVLRLLRDEIVEESRTEVPDTKQPSSLIRNGELLYNRISSAIPPGMAV